MENFEGVKEKLKNYGFKYKKYRGQDMGFFTLEISDSEDVSKLIEKHYSTEDSEYINPENDIFIVEMSEDGCNSQWAFTNDSEKYHIFGTLEDFLVYVEELRELLNKKG